MKNKEVAAILYDIADFLEVQDVEFKPRAYRRAARNIESLNEDVADVHDRGELQEIDGVGEAIADKVGEYLDTGEMSYYRELKDELPIDIDALTAVEGVGPKTAKKLYDALGVQDLDDLEEAAEAGEIAGIEGFGPTSQQNILDNIPAAREHRERNLLGTIFPAADDLRDRVLDDGAFDDAEIVGSFRRRRPTVGDLDVLATASGDDNAAAVEAFTALDVVERVKEAGETKASVEIEGDLDVDLRVVDDDQWGSALMYFTGSKDHNVTMRQRAIDRGWTLNEYGLFEQVESGDGEDGSGEGGDGEAADGTVRGDRIAGATEDEVFEALDLQFVPPEMREDTGEVDAAAAGELPELVETEQLRGDLQVHTEYSDGQHSVREMAERADAKGYDYLLLTDHGPSLAVAGFSEEDFWEQQDDVAAVDDDGDIEVELLQGIEANVVEGGLDVGEELLDACDLVVAALHSRPNDPTEQFVRAVEEEPVDILAHPQNRLLNEREPLELDLDRLIEACVDNDVAVEINSQPSRLDLDWRNVKRYRDEVKYVVSTDAHTTGELDLAHLGVSQARRGWCEADDVLNTKPLDEVFDYCGR
jgi:DNA polymerase (family 10)